jgi:hypothetical protein
MKGVEGKRLKLKFYIEKNVEKSLGEGGRTKILKILYFPPSGYSCVS